MFGGFPAYLKIRRDTFVSRLQSIIASAVRSNAACPTMNIQIRPVAAKVVPSTSPTIVACTTPATRGSQSATNGEMADPGRTPLTGSIVWNLPRGA